MKSAPTLLYIILSFFFFNSGLIGQDMTPEQQKAWTEYMTPGKYHEMLAKTAGEWKTVSKWWTDPSKEANISEGTAVNEMIMGGRYLKSTNSGMMQGMPFEGLAIEGYDNAKKEYVSTWIDNMGTGILVMSGPYDEAAKVVTLKGSVMDPSGVNVQYKELFKIVDDNRYTMELYADYGSGEVKMLEVEYTRK